MPTAVTYWASRVVAGPGLGFRTVSRAMPAPFPRYCGTRLATWHVRPSPFSTYWQCPVRGCVSAAAAAAATAEGA